MTTNTPWKRIEETQTAVSSQVHQAIVPSSSSSTFRKAGLGLVALIVFGFSLAGSGIIDTASLQGNLFGSPQLPANLATTSTGSTNGAFGMPGTTDPLLQQLGQLGNTLPTITTSGSIAISSSTTINTGASASTPVAVDATPVAVDATPVSVDIAPTVDTTTPTIPDTSAVSQVTPVEPAALPEVATVTPTPLEQTAPDLHGAAPTTVGSPLKTNVHTGNNTAATTAVPAWMDRQWLTSGVDPKTLPNPVIAAAPADPVAQAKADIIAAQQEIKDSQARIAAANKRIAAAKHEIAKAGPEAVLYFTLAAAIGGAWMMRKRKTA